MTKIGLRNFWFQFHKWIGILLAILVIPISLSGSALVWHDWVDETLNPQRHELSAGPQLASASAFVAAARPRLGEGERIASLRFEKGEAALLGAARPPEPGGGRPARTNVWLDPADARVIDVAGSNAGFVRVMHVLHGSLMVRGVGRQIVGWVGVAMLISSLTGIWLWWPTTGSVKRGLRWKRTNDVNNNLHHMSGFWIAIPLAMLSFTGVWISFPAFFAALSGAEPANTAERAARMRAQPIVATSMDVDAAVAAAMAEGGGRLASITWPTDQDEAPQWKISIAPEGGGRPAELTVDDTTGAVEQARGEPGGARPSIARTMRQWHDGAGMGVVWQIVIFIGGLVPALLGITGIIMWLRARGWRAATAKRKKEARVGRPQPAE